MAVTDVSLVRHVDEVFPRLDALFQAGESVELLAGTPGWQALQAVLEAEVDAILAKLERPQPYSRSEYAAMHGRIGGLRAAQRGVVAITAVAERRRIEQAARHEGDAEPSPER